jgi:hypothetical protein
MSGVVIDSVKISATETTSTALYMMHKTPVGLYFPDAFTGTSISFEVADPNDNWRTIADGAGADVTKTVAADKYIPLNPSDFAGVNKIRIVSGSSEAASREIFIAIREID